MQKNTAILGEYGEGVVLRDGEALNDTAEEMPAWQNSQEDWEDAASEPQMHIILLISRQHLTHNMLMFYAALRTSRDDNVLSDDKRASFSQINSAEENLNKREG